MGIACGLLLPHSWTPFPLLDAESLLLAAQSHKFQFNLYFSFISAGKSLGQDCRSSQLHNPGAQRQKMQFPHRHQCVLALRPCRSVVQPCVSCGIWEAALGWPLPLQWHEFLQDVLVLSHSVLCSSDLSCSSECCVWTADAARFWCGCLSSATLNS